MQGMGSEWFGFKIKNREYKVIWRALNIYNWIIYYGYLRVGTVEWEHRARSRIKYVGEGKEEMQHKAEETETN